MSLMSRLVLVALCLLYPAPIVLAAQWASTYGGAGYDSASAVQPTADGGYIVAGTTNSYGTGSEDAWLLRLDAAGGIVWQKTYGSPGGEFASAIARASDGGFVVAGEKYSGGGIDILVMKVDAGGNLVWQKTYGGAGIMNTTAIAATSNGGFVVATRTDSFGAGDYDAFVLNLDGAGNVVWQKTFGGSGYDQVSAIALAPGGGYIMAGSTGPPVALLQEAWILKLDANGSIVWQKTYGIGVVNSIDSTDDGGFIAAGYRRSFATFSVDPLVVKLDASGNIEWQRSFYVNATDNRALAVRKVSGGGYIVVGTANARNEPNWQNDAFVLRLDALGVITHQWVFGGPGVEIAQSVQVTADGGYIVAGDTSSSFGAGGVDAWVLKLDADASIPNCTLMGALNVAPNAIGPAAVNTAGTAASGNAASVDATFVSSDSGALHLQQCFYAVPAATEVPTLSGWARVSLVGLVLLSAAAALRGRRLNGRRH